MSIVVSIGLGTLGAVIALLARHVYPRRECGYARRTTGRMAAACKVLGSLKRRVEPRDYHVAFLVAVADIVWPDGHFENRSPDLDVLLEEIAKLKERAG